MTRDTRHGRGKKLRLESLETFMNIRNSGRSYLTDTKMISATLKYLLAICMKLFDSKDCGFICLILCVIHFCGCSEVRELPAGDEDNGGLFLPEDFEAVVVVDSLKGRARHIAVNDNGDIYVKSRFSEPEGRNVALRDTDNDGKADVIEKFGKYEKERSYGTAMRIHNEYLYFSSELSVYRYKLIPGQL